MRGTCRWLEDVRRVAEQAWRAGLRRRSRKRAMGWENFPRLWQPDVLPTPKMVPTI